MKLDLQTRIEDLYFPPGCSTIPNALKRTKKSTLKEVYDDYIIGNKKWPMTGQIRYRLIANWFNKCVDIPKKGGEMKAYQCDRCGAFYTDYDFKEDWVIKHPRDTEPGFDYIMTGALNRQPIVIDLCPRCTKTINNWLNSNKEGEIK